MEPVERAQRPELPVPPARALRTRGGAGVAGRPTRSWRGRWPASCASAIRRPRSCSANSTASRATRARATSVAELRRGAPRRRPLPGLGVVGPRLRPLWRPDAGAAEPVAALEEALRRRGGCAAGAPVWITEAGAGAPHPGAPGSVSPAQQLEGLPGAGGPARSGGSPIPAWGPCSSTPSATIPAFPVGLASADLRVLHPAYGLWLSLARARAGGAPARRLADVPARARV